MILILGFCRPQVLVQGLLMATIAKYTSAVSSASVSLATVLN